MSISVPVTASLLLYSTANSIVFLRSLRVPYFKVFASTRNRECNNVQCGIISRPPLEKTLICHSLFFRLHQPGSETLFFFSSMGSTIDPAFSGRDAALVKHYCITAPPKKEKRARQDIPDTQGKSTK